MMKIFLGVFIFLCRISNHNPNGERPLVYLHPISSRLCRALDLSQ